MVRYRIIEETGKLTNTKRFFIEYLKNRLFGKPIWKVYYQYHPEGHRRMVEFNNLEEAEKWIDYETEYVDRKIHYNTAK